MTSLARAGQVITHVDDDGHALIIENGAIAFEDGVITAVGDYLALRADHPDADVVGSDSDVLFPGFINSHHHVGLTPTQLGVPDLPLELWIAARMTSRSVDLYLDTMFSAIDMIGSGVTTVQHLRNTFAGDGEDIVTSSEEALRAYTDIGMRASFSVNIRDQHVLGYFEDEQLLARLPDSARGAVGAAMVNARVSATEGIAVLRRLRDRHADSSLLQFQLMPANLHWCSDETLLELSEFSAAEGVPIHLHLAETIYQDEYAHKRGAHSGVEHVAALRMVNPLLTLGHGVWFSERDARLLADGGASICLNSSSNLRLGSGIAPLKGWLSVGLNVALGVDEAGINDDRDMLQEMRLALYLHRTPGLDPDGWPSSSQVFRMATDNGARTTPFSTKVGALLPGRFADFVLADGRNMNFPAVAEALDAVALLVQRLRRSDIHTVFVNGRAVLADSRFVTVDRDQVMQAIADQAARTLSAADSAQRDMGFEVLGHLRSLYTDYLTEDRIHRLMAASERR
jgi:5-methylthioadenosine/S-adenosylhomocysteine deaminase